jgi:hypothetical protein
MKKRVGGKSLFRPVRNAADPSCSRAIAGDSVDQPHQGSPIWREKSAYVGRIRAKILDFRDQAVPERITKNRKEMEAILISKKIARDKAELAVVETLNVAANHFLEPLRRAGSRDDLRRANSRLAALIELIESFGHFVSKLPPKSRGKLNSVLAKQDLHNFDTEVFASIIHSIIDELSRVSPAAIAEKARLVLSDAASHASTNPVLAQIPRTAPPKILELWETIPAQTRVQVEADVRNLPPHKSAAKFLRYLVSALKSSHPLLKTGRRPGTERLFVQSIGAIWRRLGLSPGRAYFPGDQFRRPSHTPSSFQRFCDLALNAVANKARVSSRQVLHIKRKLSASTS